MTVRLVALSYDARDPAGLADFWQALLGWRRSGPADLTRDDGFGLRFAATEATKSSQNHAHLDLTSTSDDDQRRSVARVLALGGRHADVGQRAEETHVVLADPEGDELCVIAAGNAFLAGCGRVGAVACDGTRATGLFWSAAWGWPLVWDEGEETAVQSPRGGTKVTWGGYPPPPAPHRVRFEVEPVGGTALQDLVRLGARHVGTREDREVLLDPDGVRFDLLRA